MMHPNEYYKMQYIEGHWQGCMKRKHLEANGLTLENIHNNTYPGKTFQGLYGYLDAMCPQNNGDNMKIYVVFDREFVCFFGANIVIAPSEVEAKVIALRMLYGEMDAEDDIESIIKSTVVFDTGIEATQKDIDDFNYELSLR